MPSLSWLYLIGWAPLRQGHRTRLQRAKTAALPSGREVPGFASSRARFSSDAPGKVALQSSDGRAGVVGLGATDLSSSSPDLANGGDASPRSARSARLAEPLRLTLSDSRAVTSAKLAEVFVGPIAGADESSGLDLLTLAEDDSATTV